MGEQHHLGFPAPLLGMQPARLPVLHDDGEVLVLYKPVGVLVQTDPWYPRLPVLVEAIRFQAMMKKPEFRRHHIPEGGLWAVTDLDPECSGPVVLTRDRDHADELKNLLGSGQFGFHYRFLSQSRNESPPIECNLPITRHRHQYKMIVSHTNGKKSVTRFETIGRTGQTRIWEAQTAFPRRHQVLIHAHESGISVIGDETYARDKPILLSRLKKNYQHKKDREEQPLFSGPACYLHQIDLPDSISILSPLPSRWNGLLNQLARIQAVRG